MFLVSYVFFFKQKTAYEMRISDWSSDVCSSDLLDLRGHHDDAVDGADALGEVVVAVDPRLVGEHREMAVHTEDLRQQLLPEAVHYRHDDDEGGDADGDAEHREGGDDGDEALLPARAEIAQGDEALESGNEHSDGLASQLEIGRAHVLHPGTNAHPVC